MDERERGIAAANDGTPFAERVKRKWYRGDLNRAYQRWHGAGRPDDPNHPLRRELLEQARLFVGRIMAKEQMGMGIANQDGIERIERANEKDIQDALTRYDPNRPGRKATFATYLKRTVLNNIRDEVRNLKRPTHQRSILSVFKQDMAKVHEWIDEDKYHTDWKTMEEIPTAANIAVKDRDLAHWLVKQDRHLTITWRQVLRQFPRYKTEDTAGRALGRVKEAIEKAGVYVDLRHDISEDL